MNLTTPPGFVYVIHAVGTNRVKIGYSADPANRLSELQTASPFPLDLVGTRPGTPDMERGLHRHLYKHHRVGEWFEIEPKQALRIVESFIHISENERREAEDKRRESAATALMHLEMIFQAAEGEYSPKAGELEKRKAAIASFVLTGQCLADDSDRELIAKVGETVNSHLSMVNDKTDAA